VLVLGVVRVFGDASPTIIPQPLLRLDGVTWCQSLLEDAATTLSRRSIFDLILGARAATSTASPEPQADSSRKRISWDKSSLRCDVDCIP
jgi:hypothetical protein